MLLLISATATSGRRLAAERFNGVPTIQDEEGSCSPYEVGALTTAIFGEVLVHKMLFHASQWAQCRF